MNEEESKYVRTLDIVVQVYGCYEGEVEWDYLYSTSKDYKWVVRETFL